MKTIWGEKLDVNNVLPEYPRPQMVRSSYINLNGVWEYAVTDDAAADKSACQAGYKLPEKFDGNIVVPFSPECELSGVNRTVKPGQTLWYRRSFSLPEFDGARAGEHTDRVLLHFGAVDQIATIYVNGNEVCRHVGGYTAFSADVTRYLRGRGGIAG
ncbi:MAG: glycoside hydrolase family 2, partial [Clostridiales bacterium]|nr:glycoside hydrolase family 2 [Clostridiales bacterium]